MMFYGIYVDGWKPEELERFLLKTIGGERNDQGDWYVDGVIWYVEPPDEYMPDLQDEFGFAPTAMVMLWLKKLETANRPSLKAVTALLDRPGDLVFTFQEEPILRRVDGKVWLDDPDKWTLGPALKKYLDEHPPG